MYMSGKYQNDRALVTENKINEFSGYGVGQAAILAYEQPDLIPGNTIFLLTSFEKL